MSADSPPPAAAARGCWGVALVILGGVVALLSGLCAGGSIVGGALDIAHGDATLQQALGPILPFLLVSAPFLAGGIALIIWGVRMQRRR